MNALFNKISDRIDSAKRTLMERFEFFGAGPQRRTDFEKLVAYCQGLAGAKRLGEDRIRQFIRDSIDSELKSLWSDGYGYKNIDAVMYTMLARIEQGNYPFPINEKTGYLRPVIEVA